MVDGRLTATCRTESTLFEKQRNDHRPHKSERLRAVLEAYIGRRLQTECPNFSPESPSVAAHYPRSEWRRPRVYGKYIEYPADEDAGKDKSKINRGIGKLVEVGQERGEFMLVSTE